MAYSGLGAGTVGDPYQVTTRAQLMEIDGYGIPSSPSSFTGSGLNDVSFQGILNNPVQSVITITLYGVNGIRTMTINTAGTGYAANDTFSIDGGTAGKLGTGRVSSVSGGVPTALVITLQGSGYSIANGIQTTNIVGSGTGLKVNITALADSFQWRKDSGSTTTVTINTAFQTLVDGIQVKFNAYLGHTIGDVWTLNVNPFAYWKLMNDIDFGGGSTSTSSLRVSNFAGYLDGDNRSFLNYTVGVTNYYGIELKTGCTVKNLTYRIVNSVNNNEYSKERIIFGQTVQNISNGTLDNIKVITSASGQLLWFSNASWAASCSIKNIVLEGNIQGAFIGTISCVAENIKVLRTNNLTAIYPADHPNYAPIVQTLNGELKYSQHIILNYDLTGATSNIAFIATNLGSTGKITECFVMGDIKVTYANTAATNVTHGFVASSSFAATETIIDSYIVGTLNVNGGEITSGASYDQSKSGYVGSGNIYITQTRCLANIDLITPLNNNRTVFTKSNGTRLTNCIYNSTTLASITEVDGTGQTGLTDAQYKDVSNYGAFDFVNTWIMNTDGPQLRRNALYDFETEISTCNISSVTRNSSTTFTVVLAPKYTSDYGVELYQNNILIDTKTNSTSNLFTVPEEDKAYVLKSFYMNGLTKVYSTETNYAHYVMQIAIQAPTYVTVAANIVVNNPLPANLVHGSILYDNYVYGVVRQQPFPTSHGVLARAPISDISTCTTLAIKTNDTTPDENYTSSDYSNIMEQIVECQGYLYFVFNVGGVTFAGSYLCQYNPATPTTYRVFRMDSRISPATAPIITDGEYLYFSDYIHDKIFKVLASQFVGDFPKFNLTVGETFTIAATYDASSQGGHIAGGYSSGLKGEVHSGICDAEYLYASYTTDRNGTSSGYYAPLDISTNEVHKIRKSDMTAAGFVKIPKSTDDMTQNATHLFYGIEVQPGADSRTYGYGWGGYAVRKSDMTVLGLPKYEATDNPPTITSYASLIFGNYLLDAKTNKTTYILDISDVDNWSINEPVGKRVVAKYKYKETDGTTDIQGVPNEFLLAPDNTFYAFTFLTPSTLMEFQLPGFSFFAVPTVTTMDIITSGGNHTFNGFVISDGGQPILSRGFKYGPSADNLNVTILSTDITPEFHKVIPQLEPGTYYYQAFATNSEGESVQEIKNFTSSSGNTPYRYKQYIIVSRVV